MIGITQQRLGDNGQPMNWADGTPAYKYTLTEFARGHLTGDGELLRERITCKLTFFSRTDLEEFVKGKQGNLPIPAPNAKEKHTKWSPGLAWKEKNW